jgi:hypothetical protein
MHQQPFTTTDITDTITDITDTITTDTTITAITDTTITAITDTTARTTEHQKTHFFIFNMTISEKLRIKREKASKSVPLRYIDVPILMILILITGLLLALHSQTNIIDSRVFAQLTIPNELNNSNISGITTSVAPSNNVATMTIYTTNLIQGNNLNAIEPLIRKAILSNINNALFLAKGSVSSSIPVSVSAKIINQLGNNRVDTTQGIDMTKKLVATELLNAINSISTKSNTASHVVQQSAKIVVGNQAICTGIASPTKLTCSFTINIHG